MQPLRAERVTWVPKPKITEPEVKRDPAPSRAQYRWSRFWMVPLYRRLVRFGLPLGLTAAMATWFLSNEANREAVALQFAEVKRSIIDRPEFSVNLMEITGASPQVQDLIRAKLPLRFPVSSFELDLPSLQGTIAALPPVERAELRLKAGGVLEFSVTERLPSVVYRSDSEVMLLDQQGNKVMTIAARLERPDLPLISGPGADQAVDEALALLAAAGPLRDRVRGLIRVGERRWDLVVAPDIRVMLPEHDPKSALEQVLAFDQAQGLLSRAIAAVDFRNPARPTVRLTAILPQTPEAGRPDAPATEDNDT
jgi:cell division protein FtsQ